MNKLTRIIATSSLVGLAALAVGCQANKPHEETVKDFLERRIATLNVGNETAATFANMDNRDYTLVEEYNFIGGRDNPEMIIITTSEHHWQLMYESRDSSLTKKVYSIDVGDTLKLNHKGYITDIKPIYHARNSGLSVGEG